MDIMEKSLQKHEEWQGKIEIISRAPIRNREDLSLAYTPGVARPCLEIQKDENKSFELTRRANIVAVVTDGTAVLGLGDIGPSAAMPVMEGKCDLFKEFGEVDAFPICIDSKDVDEIVRTVSLISKSFGGINLEDIAAPRCFEIEKRLKECCDIPVFHDEMCIRDSPDYMRPSIQLIKNFPLTENGKCDRKRLKEIANGRSDFEIDSGYRK